MELLKRLRRGSTRKVLLPSLILLAAAAAVFYFFHCQAVFQTLSPKTLAELTPETLEGAYVEDDISFFYAQYVEEEEYRNHVPTGKITGAQYVIDFDETYYMALFVHESDLDAAGDLMEASYQYASGSLAGSELPVLHVKGTVCAMDDEVRGYYHQLAGGDTAMEEIMLPYYINAGRIGDSLPITVWLALLGSLVLLALALVPLIRALSGWYQKDLRRKLASMGEESVMLEKLEQFYEETPAVCGVRMNRDYVLFHSGPSTVLLRPWDLAWAYQSTTQHRTNGSPSGKTYAAILRTMNGKQYTLPMKEPQVQQLLSAIHDTLPGTVLGYDKELEALYRQNRDAFRARWEEAAPGCTSRS